MRKYYKPVLMGITLFAIAVLLTINMAVAQTIYLSPDTIKVCNGGSDDFDVELWADDLVTGLNAYTAFISYDKDLIEVFNVYDTTYWECLSWQTDSVCNDSAGIAWDLDSICLAYDCQMWEITDSICLDSMELWDLDSTCYDWIVEYAVDSTCLDSIESWNVDTIFAGWDCTLWQVDSTCLDSIPEWQIDSLCLNWDCTEWDELLNCIDSSCTEWDVDTVITGWICSDLQIDSLCLDSTENWYIDSLFMGWECLSWEIDSTIVDSLCAGWQVDSTFLGYECTDWSIDSVCIDSTCVLWQVDSTETAWECTGWDYIYTCLDSVETTSELADFFSLDTIIHDVTEGPLMHSPEAQTIQFFSRVSEDSTQIIIESIIFWPRVDVDGPGLLATLHMRNLANGEYNFTFDSLIVLDVNGTRIPTSGVGNVLLFNADPAQFNLQLPVHNDAIQISPGDSVMFSWTESISPCPGYLLLYELIVSPSEMFAPQQSKIYTDIDASSIVIDASSGLFDGLNFWKVRAYTSYGGEAYCYQDYHILNLDILASPPGNFSLLVPHHDSLLETSTKENEYFDWGAAAPTLPDDIITYDLHVTLSTAEKVEDNMVFEGLSATEYSIDIDSFNCYCDYSWRVRAVNRIGMDTWSNETWDIMFYLCGDGNGDGQVNVGDAVYLIGYIFKNGPAPILDEAGDANCDGLVNVGDPVYLISYIFRGGPAPCADCDWPLK